MIGVAAVRAQVADPAPLRVDADRLDVLRGELGSGFRVLHTAHFSFVSDVPAGRVAALRSLVESTLRKALALTDRLEITTTAPDYKMLVVYFNDWPAYEAFARSAGLHVEERIPGMFDENANRCVAFHYANAARMQALRARIDAMPADDAAERARQSVAEHERLINATVFRHEIAHLVLFNLGVQRIEDRDRRWLKEGLAMQFEPAEGPDVVNPWRLADLALWEAMSPPMTLRELVADPKLIGPGADHPQAAYAMAWALVHYLMAEKPRAFSAYLRTAPDDDGAERVRRFKAAFGPLDERFEARFRRFVETLRAKATTTQANR